MSLLYAGRTLGAFELTPETDSRFIIQGGSLGEEKVAFVPDSQGKRTKPDLWGLIFRKAQ
jgi:hypothetical protein